MKEADFFLAKHGIVIYNKFDIDTDITPINTKHLHLWDINYKV